ncbi:hypothetical protein DFH06DRAFT_1138361 [Mycena polygramma]|nr:hypothetical protein DFH06DRAFT_1138361 [Mycena polygramma]
MDFNVRGKCMRTTCGSGCTVFVPREPGANEAPPAHPALVKCAVCSVDPGCVAGQHAEISQTIPEPAQRPPPAAPKSGTFKTMYGARGFAAPSTGPSVASPFQSHAQKRQEDIGSQLKEPLNMTPGPGHPFLGKKFHPAGKSQLEGDLNGHNSKGKKRKHAKKEPAESDPEPATKRPAGKASKPPPTKDWTVVLAENTKDVAANKYEKPNADKLVQLNRHGYVQAVPLHMANTGDDILRKVTAAFHAVAELGIYGFRVLEVQAISLLTTKGKASKKQRYMLKPVKGELGMDTWTRAQAQTTVRGAGSGFKNTIFIALHPLAPNLAFPGVDVALTSPDHDLSTDEEEISGTEDDSKEGEDGSPQGPATGSPVQGLNGLAGVKSSQPENKREHQSPPLFDSDPGSGEEDNDLMDETQSVPEDFADTSAWEPFPAAHIRLIRAMKNIAKPDSANQHPWWKSSPLAHLGSFNLIQPLLADLIDSAVSRQLQVDVFFGKVIKYVLEPLKPLIELARDIDNNKSDAKSRADLRRDFGQLFGIGPGGIDIVIPAFSFLYEGLARIRTEGFTMTTESRRTESRLEEASEALLTCLNHFRRTVPRSLWEPKGGFRELAHILWKYDKELPIGNAENPMLAALNNIDLRLDSVDSIRLSLEEAFGSATDAGNMKHSVVVGGEHGLGRFYTAIVEPLLDTVNRSDYDEVVLLFKNSSRALGRKCGNYIKSKPGHGAKPKSSPQPDDDVRSSEILIKIS